MTKTAAAQILAPMRSIADDLRLESAHAVARLTLLAARQVAHALIGAAALAVHGVSRSTVDQDLRARKVRVKAMGHGGAALKAVREAKALALRPRTRVAQVRLTLVPVPKRGARKTS